MKTVQIVCAKGFSRRIPEKNMHPFCGKPLVYWPILQGMTSRLVDEVIVSTESEKIAAVAEELGAEVFWRQYQDNDATIGTVPFFEVRDALLKQGRITKEDIFVSAWAPNCILKPDDTDRLIRTLMHLNRETNGECESVGLRSEERTINVGVRIGPNLVKHVIQCVNIPATFSATGTILVGKSITSAAYVKSYFREKPPAYWRAGYAYYMDVEPWQMHDMDTIVEMEFGETAMEHYILKGRGEEVYKEYRYGEADDRNRVYAGHGGGE